LEWGGGWRWDKSGRFPPENMGVEELAFRKRFEIQIMKMILLTC